MHTTIYKRDKDTILFLIKNTCFKLCFDFITSILLVAYGGKFIE